MRASVKGTVPLFTALFAVASLSCAQVLEIEDTTFDPNGAPVVVKGDWSCLGKIEAPKVDPAVTRIKISMRITNFATQLDAPDITIHACSSVTDINCAQTSQPETATSDAEGKVTLEVPVGPNGFNGYLELTDSRTENQISVSYLIFFAQPLVADFDIPRFFVVDPGTLAGLSGSTPDPARGQFSTSPFDCASKLADGATLSVDTADNDPAATRWYLEGGTSVSKTAKAFDSSGLGGFFNVAAGNMKAQVILADKRVAAESKVFVRPGFFSTLDMKPNIITQLARRAGLPGGEGQPTDSGPLDGER